MRIPLLLAALLLTGCLSGDAPGASVQQAASAPIESVIPIRYEGRTDLHACAPTGPGACHGATLKRGEGTWQEVPFPGAPLRLDVNVTWTAESPATARLWASLLATSPCGEGCVSGRQVGDGAAGRSPLALSVTSFELEEGEGLAVLVRVAPVAPHSPLLSYEAAPQQAFAVEGDLVVLGAP